MCVLMHGLSLVLLKHLERCLQTLPTIFMRAEGAELLLQMVLSSVRLALKNVCHLLVELSDSG